LARPVFGKARIDQFALVFDTDVFRAAAIAEELAALVELGLAGNRPPCLPHVLARLAECEPDGQVDELAARRELELERAVRLLERVVGIGFEQVGERLGQQLVQRRSQLFRRPFGDIDQPPFGVAGPQPAESRALEIVEHFETARAVMGMDDARAAGAARRGFFVRRGPAASQALKKSHIAHFGPVSPTRSSAPVAPTAALAEHG
jgi:hypothetical protein